MALNDLAKPVTGVRSVKFSAATPTRSQGKPDASLQRLARPTRHPDFFLGQENSESARSVAMPAGLSQPKKNARVHADKAVPSRMPEVASLPKVAKPRALELKDVQGNAAVLASLHKHFTLMHVQGDSFVTFVAGMLQHGARFPERAAALAEGLRSLEEPTGEISPKVHAGYAMLKRWAQALVDGRGSDARDNALAHPDAIAAMALAFRGIVRHMQVFGAMQRPDKSTVGHAADLEALHALAHTCGLKLAVHGADEPRALQTDGSALNLLAQSLPGHFDVLVA